MSKEWYSYDQWDLDHKLKCMKEFLRDGFQDGILFTCFYHVLPVGLLKVIAADPTEVNQQNVSAVHLLNAESFNKTW